MNINIKATKFELTPSIEEYIASKLVKTVDRLTKRVDSDSVKLGVEVAKTTRHHQKGDVWKAEAKVWFGAKRVRAEEYGESIQEAIDLLEEAIGREIVSSKGKDQAMEKRAARSLKRATRVSRAARLPKRSRVREEGM